MDMDVSLNDGYKDLLLFLSLLSGSGLSFFRDGTFSYSWFCMAFGLGKPRKVEASGHEWDGMVNGYNSLRKGDI